MIYSRTNYIIYLYIFQERECGHIGRGRSGMRYDYRCMVTSGSTIRGPGVKRAWYGR